MKKIGVYLILLPSNSLSQGNTLIFSNEMNTRGNVDIGDDVNNEIKI